MFSQTCFETCRIFIVLILQPGGIKKSSVVDPKLLFSDPDPALDLIPDPACLTKVIVPYHGGGRRK
jgi:hypothetical protein